MKIIKGYFLFFSQHPILYNLIWFIPSILSFAFLLEGENSYIDIKEWYGLVLLGLFIGHIILVYFMAGRFIIRKENPLSELEKDDWFRVAVLDNGQKIILTKPIWARGKIYFVLRPDGLYSKEISCHFWVGSKYKNSSVSVPVIIRLKFNKDFDQMEVFEALLKDYPKNTKGDDELDFERYVENVFVRFNEQFQPKINELVEKYSRREISEPEFLDNLIEIIVFPEKLLSNIEDVQLHLGNPTFSSCKGVSC